MSNRIKVILACVACIVLGYFIGREHLKYQMRTAMQDAVTEMQAGISAAFDGSESPAAPEPEVKAPTEAQPIVVRLTDKGFSPKDIYNGKYEEEITITIEFSNKTGKDIRAFDGVLEFTDLLGNRILGSRMEINDRVAKGSSLSWEGALEYNQFMNDHQRLRSEPKENLKVAFYTGKVLFEDGTTKEFN